MKDILDFFDYAREYDHPGYISVMACICIFSRNEGRDITPAIIRLREYTNGEIKEAIKIIRAFRSPFLERYPIEEMVNFLWLEVMGKVMAK